MILFFNQTSKWRVGTLILILALAAHSTNAQGGEESYPEFLWDWDSTPLCITLGPNLSRYKDQSTSYPVKILGEGGFLSKYSVSREFPFWTGLEFQMRGYRIKSFKSGKTNDGRTFEQRSEGDTRINYLVVPFLFSLPAGKPENKFHVLAGASLGVRIYFRQNYTYSFSIPADSIVINGKENKIGNDALDFLDFNTVAGCSYRISPRMELWALATWKAFGFSIGQQDFFSRHEKNTMATLKLIYRIGSLEDIPFF